MVWIVAFESCISSLAYSICSSICSRFVSLDRFSDNCELRRITASSVSIPPSSGAIVTTISSTWLRKDAHKSRYFVVIAQRNRAYGSTPESNLGDGAHLSSSHNHASAGGSKRLRDDARCRTFPFCLSSSMGIGPASGTNRSSPGNRSSTRNILVWRYIPLTPNITIR